MLHRSFQQRRVLGKQQRCVEGDAAFICLCAIERCGRDLMLVQLKAFGTTVREFGSGFANSGEEGKWRDGDCFSVQLDFNLGQVGIALRFIFLEFSAATLSVQPIEVR
jgi:hypothetical protein